MDKNNHIVEFLKLLEVQIGQEIHVGPWLQIDQQRIDQFAEVTGDQQWIHIDPERAEKESPYGSTIAHGYLTLSLLPYLTESNHPDFFQKNYPGMKYRVNYGLNGVDFRRRSKLGQPFEQKQPFNLQRKSKGQYKSVI